MRNPIFLAIRFPDCFSIHYNPTAPKLEGKNEEQVLAEFQKALKECYSQIRRKKEEMIKNRRERKQNHQQMSTEEYR